MIAKLQNHQRQREANEKGFTLIELLVVIIIIGILAAIAIPLFLNQQKSAHRASLQSDVKNSVGQVMDATKGSGPFEGAPTVYTGESRVLALDHPSGDPHSYLIAGYSNAAGTGMCYDSTNGKVNEENCPSPNPAEEQADANTDAEESGSAPDECFADGDSAYAWAFDFARQQPWIFGDDESPRFPYAASSVNDFEEITGAPFTSVWGTGCYGEFDRGYNDGNSMTPSYNP